MTRATLPALALLALSAVGCGGGDDRGTTAPAARTAPRSDARVAGKPYPEAVRTTFMRECERSSGGRRATCRCALRRLEATISFRDFKREETAVAAGGRPSRRLTNAIADCR